jgi:DNA-directed RNA polymerase subunit L
MTQDVERIYERNEIGEPNVYQFLIESIGFYHPQEILSMGVNILLNKLILLKEEFRKTNSNKVVIVENVENMDFFHFLINEENDTIGNLIQSYINNNENIFYAGYLIEHPLKYNFLLKIKLKENNNIENCILIIENSIEQIISILNEMNDVIKKI